MNDVDERIVGEFVAGGDVPAIAARYNVPEAYVDRVIEEATAAAPQKRSWSLARTGNRVFLAILVAWTVWLLLQASLLHLHGMGGLFFAALVAVIFYAVVTAAFGRRKQR